MSCCQQILATPFVSFGNSLGWVICLLTAMTPLSAADLLLHPDLPSGFLYPSGAGDPHPAQITPILGDPAGAFAGSDYYAVRTGTVLNPGSTFGGIVFVMPSTFVNAALPQRYKLQYALKSADQSMFEIAISNQDGGGEANKLSHITAVSPDWRHYTRYATLDGLPFNGHLNIPRHALFFHSGPLVGGPQVPFLIDQITLMPVLIGDFDEDGNYDCHDVNALVAAIANSVTDSKFDLNSDGLVDLVDLDEWRSAAGEALFGIGRVIQVGDADLDGVVDGSDFNVWNSHKFTQEPAWCLGDFNADGNIDGSDFNLWNGNKFTSSAERHGRTGTGEYPPVRRTPDGGPVSASRIGVRHARRNKR